MSIPPKTVSVVYKGISAKLVFVPDTKKWKWEFVITHKTVFTDYEESEAAARLAVRREIDRYSAHQEKAAH